MSVSKHKRIAVFGACGYLGRHLCADLSMRGFAYDAYDLRQEGDAKIEKFSPCDVSDPDFFSTFAPESYDGIVFLAGLSGPERSFERPERFVQVNVLGLVNLLQRLAPFGANAPRVIFPSSRLVYEGGGVVDENATRRSRSVYAATKVAAEELLSAYEARFGVPSVVLRICALYGNLLSTDYSYGTMEFFISQCRRGQSILVYGDGQCRKTYTYIGDLCEVISRCLERNLPSGRYNVGGCDYSLQEVAHLVARRFGGTVQNVPWPENALRVEMGNISLDASRLDDAVGKIPYRRLEDFIERV